MEGFETIRQAIEEVMWVLIPLVVLQFILAIAAAVHAARSTHFKIGNKPIWIIVSICVNIIGPILYFTIGKGEPEEYDE
jgi:hypothetical protein